MVNNIKEIIVNFWEKDFSTFYKRNFNIPDLKIKKVVSLIWPRRSWKTSICFLKIQELLEKWIDIKNIFYVNFEDERLIDFELKDFDELLKSYFELSWKSTKDKNIYFFFDEIQNISWWEKFVVRLLNDFDVKVVVTWSSAKMLSKEINTALRWKNISFEIFPLNFEEFLNFKNIKFDKNFQYSIDGFNFYKKILKEFLTYWAFPEVVLEEEKIKNQILKTYYDLIFYKDIVDRYKVRDISNLKKFRKYLAYNFWEFISIKKISEQLKVSYQILSNWFEYFQDSYFWFALKNFSFSLMWVEKSVAKFYLSDNGLFYSNFWQLNEMNLSRLFENAVFLEFRKFWFVENESIFYFKTKKYDIDFILFKNWEIIPVQVCYQLNKENFKREVLQLEKIIKEFNLKKAYLIVWESIVDFESEKVELLMIQDLKYKI